MQSYQLSANQCNPVNSTQQQSMPSVGPDQRDAGCTLVTLSGQSGHIMLLKVSMVKNGAISESKLTTLQFGIP